MPSSTPTIICAFAQLSASTNPLDVAVAQGGGMYVGGGTTTLTNVIVHNNTAPTGASMQPVAGLLYYALPTPPGHWLPNADCVANREGCRSWEACSRSPQKEICATTSGTATDSPSPWTPPNCKKPIFIQPCAWQIPACADQADACLLGKNIYFTPYFPVEVTFPNPCAAGYLGSNETAKQTSAMCGGKCPAGHYCPTAVTLVPIPCPDGHYCDEGASTPKPCPAGTRTNPALAPMTSEGQCVECSPGTWCSVGSLVETPCSSGTFNNQSTQVRCTPCAGGTYQEATSATACKACERGSYCPQGAAAALPCIEGTYSSATNLASAAECTAADPGFFAPTGSEVQTPCAAGTIAPRGGLGVCEPCAAGSFQPASGHAACENCRDSYYCSLGAAAALPCPGGTMKPPGFVGAMTSVDQCVTCPEGTFCPVGSEAAAPCAAGTYNAEPQQESCTKCEPGKFQALEGNTTCIDCTPGYYCALGAAAALPCPSGSFSTATDLSALSECTNCPEGSFCVAGATAPIVCAAGSFAQGTKNGLCTSCPEGTYTAEAGAASCDPCPSGRQCPLGCSVPLPASCAPGTFIIDMSNYENASSCDLCPIGSFCFGGAAQPEPCGVGTIAAAPGLERCTPCLAGSFQDTRGMSVCNECNRGFFCSKGAATPIPCPGECRSPPCPPETFELFTLVVCAPISRWHIRQPHRPHLGRQLHKGWPRLLGASWKPIARGLWERLLLPGLRRRRPERPAWLQAPHNAHRRLNRGSRG